MSIKRIITLFGGAALVGLVAFAVWWLQPGSTPPSLGGVLKAETLDIGIFQEQMFSRLRAARVPTPPAERGRGNPFSPPARNSIAPTTEPVPAAPDAVPAPSEPPPAQ